MTNIKKPALLAPAGSEEMAVLAFEAGADMVYAGPRGWSRRTRAFEVDDSTIEKIADYAAANGKILKLAFNTLPSSDEIPAGIESISRYYGMGLRHFIMTDPGFVRQIKNRFPDTVITASVGCSVMNIREFNFYRAAGFDVMVAPSEMPVGELEELKQQFEGEIEVLIHANRDYTYLGRCTMSSYFRFRHEIDEKGKDNFFGSPNRGGLCYRVCKSSWNSPCLQSAGCKPADLGNVCYLSFEEIPEYIRIGIDCLKIQGREYSPKLVEKLVKFYRQLVDECAENPDTVKNPQWKERLIEMEAQRDFERNKRTGALLEECRDDSRRIFANLEPLELKL
ncbi:MAG: U32 family peptidase [Firmicutes bacterium]|nr:U32 family peptidase [Bacillota bacterium]